MRNSVFFGILLGLVVLGIMLRVQCFQGLSESDDLNYIAIAKEVVSGRFFFGQEVNYAPVFPLRLSMILPITFIIKTFGSSENLLLIFPFIFSLVAIPLLSIVTKNIYNSETGIICATFLAITPIEVMFATLLYPDMLSTLFFNLGALLLIYDFTRSNHSTIKRTIVTSIFIATLWGLSWTTKESAVYEIPAIVLICGVALLKDKSNLVTLALVGLLVSLIFLAESLFYYSYNGDLFFRIHEIKRNFTTGGTSTYFFNPHSSAHGWKEGEYGAAVSHRVLVEGPQILLLSKLYGFIPLLALISILLPVRWDIKRVYAAIWFFGIIIIYNFGSTSLSFYQPLVMNHRYAIPILFPAMLFLADSIYRLSNNMRNTLMFVPSKVLSLLLMAIPIWVSTSEIQNLKNIGPTFLSHRKVTASIPPAATVIGGNRTLNRLEMFSSTPFSHRFYLDSISTGSIPSGAIIAWDLNTDVALLGKMGAKSNLPRNWVEIASDGSVYIYQKPYTASTGNKSVVTIPGAKFSAGKVDDYLATGTRTLNSYFQGNAQFKVDKTVSRLVLRVSTEAEVSPIVSCTVTPKFYPYQAWTFGPYQVIGTSVFKENIALVPGEYNIVFGYHGDTGNGSRPTTILQGVDLYE